MYVKEIEVDELTDSVMAWFSDKQLMKYYTNSQKVITRDSLIAAIEQGKKREIHLLTGFMIYSESY